MSKKIVEHNVDLANLPPLSEKQKAELSALTARPDGAIDYGEIPPLTEEFWKNAIRGRFYKPMKTSTTVRIDSDVLEWLRARGAREIWNPWRVHNDDPAQLRGWWS